MLRDAFGHLRFIRWGMTNLGGYLSVLQLRVLNRLEIGGLENLRGLPRQRVLLVSNHHTYYMDSIVVHHTVSYLNRPYLLWPRTNLFVVAAVETMEKSGWLPRIMAYNGTINIKRTWRDQGQPVDRKVDPADVDRIGMGLEDGWVLTYPQGTTTPGAPGRIGCAQLIRRFKPIVVPVQIGGLREAFDKTGLRLQRTGVRLSVRYGPPVEIDFEGSDQQILGQVMAAIGES